MKKIAVLVLGVSFALAGFAACGGDDASSDAPSDSPVS